MRRCNRPALAGVAALLFTSSGHCAEAVVNVRAQAGSQHLQAAELRWQHGPLRSVLAATRIDGGTHLRVNELAYDTPLGNGFLTAGKKVMSWDVGYAFRPLDVVQREDRRALNPLALEGVPMLAWESFDADSATTIVWSNPGKGRAGDPRDDGAVAMRFYRQRGPRDEYAVLRLSKRNGIEAGASFSHVASAGLELHGSLLWQQRPKHGGKAMAGFTYTTEARFSAIGEIWVDRAAPQHQQRNLMLRASQYVEDVEVSADMLWQPQSGSRIGTLSASWKTGPWLFSASYRRFSGIAARYQQDVALASIQRGF